MTLVSAHSLGFWVLWLLQGKWLQEALDMGSRVNNLAGGISFLCGLALWITSLEAARRSNYTLFTTMHHLGFWGFMLCGCMHVQSMVWYFLPALLLYAVDGVYRLTQGTVDGGCARLLRAFAVADEQGGVCALTVSTPRYGLAEAGFVWLSVPAISLTQWHPFEYVACAGDAGSPGALLMHIKSYNRWTQQLVSLVQQRGTGFSVKLEGPFAAPVTEPGMGHTHHPASHKEQPASGHQALVMVAGGIGISAVLAVLQELDSSQSQGLPMLLVWAVRHTSELQVVAPVVEAMARRKGLVLTTHIFFTGAAAALVDAAKQPPPPAQHGQAVICTSDTPGDAKPAFTLLMSAADFSLAAPAVPVAATTSLCPVVAGAGIVWQAAHKLAMHLAVFTGALVAILSVRYWATVAPTTQGAHPWSSARAGAAYVVATSLCSLLAGGLVLWLSVVLKACSSGSSSNTSCGACDGQQEGEHVRQPLLAPGEAGEAVSQPGGGADSGTVRLPIQLGRPPLEQLLGTWLAGVRQLPASGAGAGTVGVYVMGPPGLCGAVRLLCVERNRAAAKQQQPLLVFSLRTHEL